MSHDPASMRRRLLDWYDRQGRSLPWRIRPEDRQGGIEPDPYKVWLSEIMLQQTTIPHAAPYWEAFIQRWPSVHDLAQADRDDVMAAWAGLGYYARARNMHACARTISQVLDGQFPQSIEGLKKLPGIGDYTANAIAAICFDQPSTVVDGNVERVISRQFAIETPIPKAKPEIKARAAEISDPDRPGDYAQAIMDLGAVVCTPRKPDCPGCPWQDDCLAHQMGTPESFPVKAKKTIRPVRYGTVFHITRETDQGLEILLRRRPDQGLLGGMMELPGSEWANAEQDVDFPFDGPWQSCGNVRHVFTHFELRLTVTTIQLSGAVPLQGQWISQTELDQVGLPSVMMKAVRLGLS